MRRSRTPRHQDLSTESIEPPVPSRGRARYVLQVVPGRERAVAERVKALAGPELVRDCFALSYCILKKNQAFGVCSRRPCSRVTCS